MSNDIGIDPLFVAIVAGPREKRDAAVVELSPTNKQQAAISLN